MKRAKDDRPTKSGLSCDAIRTSLEAGREAARKEYEILRTMTTPTAEDLMTVFR